MPNILQSLFAPNPREARSQFMNPTWAADGAPAIAPPDQHPTLLRRMAEGFAPSQQQAAPQQQPTSMLGKIAAGLNTFGNEMLMPTSGIGRWGAYVNAAAGNPLGEASMAAMKDQREQGDALLDRQYKQAQIARALRGESYAPHYFESNSGDQYVVNQGGQPQRIFQDPTPKTTYQWIKNPDGTMTAIPVPVGGIPNASSSGKQPPAVLPKDFDFGGGGAGNGAGTFQR